MKALIIYHSGYHGNTEKIAKAIAEALGADCKRIQEVQPSVILEYDLIGFGSGIYYTKHHAILLKFIERLASCDKEFFIFSTSGMGKTEFHGYLKNKLIEKNYKFVGEFACKGFDTFGPLKLFGGINKDRPNDLDLANARSFASSLKNR